MSVSAEGVRSSYETWHERLEIDREGDAPWHRLVKQHLEPGRDLRDKRLLEIACGRGGFSCWLASQAIRPREIVAVDFAATAIRKGESFAAERRLAGITWEIGDIQNLAHADESFDTVVSCETIEHVADPNRAVQELARVLKPGGRLLLTTPNYLGTIGLYRAYMRLTGRKYTEEGQPINNFMLLPLTRASIASARLRVKSVDGVGHYLPFPGRPPIEVPMLNNPRFFMRWLALHSLVIAEKS